MSTIQSMFTDGVFTLSDDGGNSQVLPLSMGDLTIDGLVPDGRELVKGETRGALTGTRKGARVYPTLKVTGKLAAPNAPFHLLALGKIAGFVSTTADIGDYASNNFDFSLDYGAESRSFSGDDIVLTGFAVAEGSPSTVVMTFEILGPLKADLTTLIPSR